MDKNPVYKYGIAFRTLITGTAFRLYFTFETVKKAYRTVISKTGKKK